MKRVAFEVFAAIMLAIAVFVASVNFCMEHVKVYEEPDGVVLELCGQEWIHNAKD